VSLLLQRDLLSFAFLFLCFVMVFGVMAITRRDPDERGKPK